MTGRGHEFQPHARGQEPERGFALLLVIWMLALLTLLAAGVAADTSSETVIAHNRLDSAKARAHADSGVVLAIARLLAPDPAGRPTADGQTENFRVGSDTVAVSIADEGGKIDLNAAPLDLIGGLADELGIDPTMRAALVSGIAARRQAFAAAHSDAVASFYVSGGADPGGLDAQPFADTSELSLIPGMTRAAAARLLPYVTVYSQRPTINPMTAARETLLAVPGISPQEIDFFLTTRALNTASIEKPALSGVDRYVAVGPLRAATITARAVASGGAAFTRETVILMSGNLPGRPYRILRWQQPHEIAPTS
jgi:general secretion pathway protein K